MLIPDIGNILEAIAAERVFRNLLTGKASENVDADVFRRRGLTSCTASSWLSAAARPAILYSRIVRLRPMLVSVRPNSLPV